MSRRGENIYKRKDGRWEGRYIKARNRDGKAIYGFLYAGTYGEVRKKVQAAKSEIEEYEYSRDNPLFGIIAEQWIGYIMFDLKQSTIIKYRNMLDNHILPALGHIHISDVTTEKAEGFVKEKLKNGRIDGRGGLSVKSVKDIFAIVRSILKYAQSHDFKITCHVNEIRIKYNDRSVRVLDRTEQLALEKYIYDNMSLKNLGILMSLYMGLRIGELCALQWADINLADGILYVRKTMQRLQRLHGLPDKASSRTEVIVTAPKSDAAFRIIPIPDFISLRLKEYSEDDDAAYMLTGSTEHFIEPRTFQNHLKRLVRLNNMEPFNYHALRHTFATRCIEDGFDVKSLSEILGHSSVKITLDRYVHSSMDLKRQNMLKVSSPIFHKPSEL